MPSLSKGQSYVEVRIKVLEDSWHVVNRISELAEIPRATLLRESFRLGALELIRKWATIWSVDAPWLEENLDNVVSRDGSPFLIKWEELDGVPPDPPF